MSKTIEELKIEAAVTEIGLGGDFSNKDLSGVNFENANVSLTDLRNTNLSGANLKNANLEGADLTGANLEGAYLYGANLIHACLTHANLKNANLRSANLTCAVLIKANLETADMVNANLVGANLTGANLYGTDLEHANLARADLSFADLSCANLEKANLYHTNLFEAVRRNLDYIKGKTLKEPITGYKCIRKDIIAKRSSNRKATLISLPMIMKLEIPKGAVVFSINGSKFRTNKANTIKILKYGLAHMTEIIHSLTGVEESKIEIVDCLDDRPAYSTYDPDFIYPLGKIVEVLDFDLQYNVECSSGIHFFMTEEEAMNYIWPARRKILKRR